MNGGRNTNNVKIIATDKFDKELQATEFTFSSGEYANEENLRI